MKDVDNTAFLHKTRPAATSILEPLKAQRTRRHMDTLSELAATYAALAAQIEQAQERQAVIRERIIASTDYGTHEAGGLKVMVQHNRRLDPAAVQKAYPVTQHPELYKPSVDTAAVKRHLSPLELEAYYTEGAPKVVIS